MDPFASFSLGVSFNRRDYEYSNINQCREHYDIRYGRKRTFRVYEVVNNIERRYRKFHLSFRVKTGYFTAGTNCLLGSNVKKYKNF